MEGLLQDPAVQGGVLPFIFGLVFVFAFRGLGGAPGGRRWAILGAALAFLPAYLILEGVAPFPPVASKQKLMYLAIVAIALGFVLEIGVAGRVAVRVLAALYAAGALAWLAANTLSRGPSTMDWIELAVLWVAGTLVLWFLDQAARPDGGDRDDESTRGGVHAPSLLLVAALAGGAVSLLGAFIGFAQLSIAIGAIFGAFMLVNYVGYVRTGQTLGFGPIGVLGAGGAWLAGVYIAALFGGDVDPWALGCLALIFPADQIARRLSVGPSVGGRAMEPLIYGVIVAIPAIAAVIVAAQNMPAQSGY